MSEFEKLLEPGVKTVVGVDAKTALSIAISLKRIADTLDGTAAGINVGATIFGGVVNVDTRNG